MFRVVAVVLCLLAFSSSRVNATCCAPETYQFDSNWLQAVIFNLTGQFQIARFAAYFDWKVPGFVFNGSISVLEGESYDEFIQCNTKNFGCYVVVNGKCSETTLPHIPYSNCLMEAKFLGNVSLAGDELSAYSYNGTDTTGNAQYFVSLVDGNCQAVASAVLNYHGDAKPMLEHMDAELQLNLSYEPLSTTAVFHKPPACSSLVPLETKPRFLEALAASKFADPASILLNYAYGVSV